MLSDSLIVQIKELISDGKYESALQLAVNIDLTKTTLGQTREVMEVFDLIPEKIKVLSPEHCLQQTYIHTLFSNEKEISKWFNILVSFRDARREGTPSRNKLENYICRANIMRSKSDNSQVLLLLSTLYNDIGNGNPNVRSSVTSKRPSILRGSKDCSEWAKYYRAVCSILNPMTDSLFPEGSKGITETGVGEYFFERNDINEAIMALAPGMNSDDIEVVFAAYAVLTRIYSIEGNTAKVDELLERMTKTIEEHNADWLLMNFEAFKTEIAISRGEGGKIETWLSEISPVIGEKVFKDVEYAALVQVKAMMALGQWRDAALKLQPLTEYFLGLYRDADVIECTVLSAINCMMLGSEVTAFTYLEKAIKEARQFGYLMIFADKGKLMFRLMSKYLKEYDGNDTDYIKYVNKIISLSKSISLALPGLFNVVETSDEIPQLTDTETRILQMIDEGLSNKEIASDISVKLTTVKFHIRNIFDKFDVSGRVELLRKARHLKIIV